MKVYVAMLDTGGISYSGREYVAVAETPDDARQAIYRAWRAEHRNRRAGGDPAATLIPDADALNDYYGVHVTEPISLGRAVRTA